MRRSTLFCALVLVVALGMLTLPSRAQSPIDVDPGPSGSRPNSMTAIDGTLYFEASTPSAGAALWTSDGTADGTRLVKDLAPTLDLSIVGPFFDVGGTVLFRGQDDPTGAELWTTDGTTTGTQRIKDIDPGPASGLGGSSAYVVYKGELVFAADGGSGVELWTSDGTTAGTQKLKEINPGSQVDGDSTPRHFTVVDGTLYFEAFSPSYGAELWKTDGTTAGTQRVTDLAPGPDGAYLDDLTEAGGRLFFVHYPPGTTNYELWTSDGTADGTTIVQEIESGSSGSFPRNLTEVDGTLYFSTRDHTLWRSQGTAPTTQQVQSFSGTRLKELTVVGSTLYFAHEATSGDELWKSDGTAPGTVRLAPIPGSSSRIAHIGAAGSTVFFNGRDDTHGAELWASAGTPATTGLVKDLYPGSEGAFPNRFTDLQGTLVFSAENAAVGDELWTTGQTRSLRLSAGDTPEQSLPALDLTIDVAQADNPFALTAFRDPNVSTEDLSLPGSQALAARGLWTVSPGNPGTIEAELCFGLDDLTVPRSAVDFPQLRVYERPDPSASWGRIQDGNVRLRSNGTAPDPDALCATVSSFSQFAVTAAPSALPVELASMEATRAGDSTVELTWQTASETGNAGFRVQHRTGVDSSWTRVGFVESKAAGGTATEALRYRFTAEDLSVGTHQFRLRQVDLDGSAHLHDPVSIRLRMQEAVRLGGPAPNPVRGPATVSFAVKEQTEARLTLYNTLGQRVRTVYRGTPAAGEAQTARLDVSGLASGVYFLRLRAGGATETTRVTVVR